MTTLNSKIAKIIRLAGQARMGIHTIRYELKDQIDKGNFDPVYTLLRGMRKDGENIARWIVDSFGGRYEIKSTVRQGHGGKLVSWSVKDKKQGVFNQEIFDTYYWQYRVAAKDFKFDPDALVENTARNIAVLRKIYGVDNKQEARIDNLVREMESDKKVIDLAGKARRYLGIDNEVTDAEKEIAELQAKLQAAQSELAKLQPKKGKAA